jgi:hypothetical protein
VSLRPAWPRPYFKRKRIMSNLCNIYIHIEPGIEQSVRDWILTNTDPILAFIVLRAFSPTIVRILPHLYNAWTEHISRQIFECTIFVKPCGNTNKM